MASADIQSTFSQLLAAPSPFESVDKKVNTWLQKAKLAITLVNEVPAAALALNTTKNALPPQLTHILLLTVFGKLNHFNDHYLQHIVAATLALYHLAGYDNDEKANAELLGEVGPYDEQSDKKLVYEFLSAKGLSSWLEILRLKRVVFSAKNARALSSAKVNRAQRLCLLSKIISRSAPDKRQSTFTQCVRLIPVHHHFLLSSLPLLFERAMPGEKVYASGFPATIVDIQQSHSFAALAHNIDRESGWVPSASVRTPIRQYIELDEFIALFEDTRAARIVKGGQPFFPTTYNIQRPPSALLHIIDELQKRDIDISILCEKIEHAPTFNHFLISTASQDNRLQLPVKNIKQAVLTYGTERVGDMLVQFALMERLTQHEFPLLDTCKQFTLVASAFASHIASLTKTKFTAQSAALTMTFACSPLFTLPGLKVTNTLPIRSNPHFSINNTFKIVSPSPWLSIAGELAGNWHQSATWRAVLHQCNKANDAVPTSLRKEHAVISLGFYLAKAYLLTTIGKDLSNTKEAKLWMSVLSLSSKDLAHIVNEQRNLLVCPLPR
ncbi:histidine kinase [Alteromonas sp. BMJM2]|uniref:histidine kinase n=1 Tax=Alteromonas sp. BMJM2 TaxID=2954241 RepID=UPI0022B301DF|nr:histidine kinase [Alteromonas sp. BMJM2]